MLELDLSAKTAASAVNVTKPAGTGLKLMKGFARQLSGTFCGEQTSEGYVASLTFPTPK